VPCPRRSSHPVHDVRLMASVPLAAASWQGNRCAHLLEPDSKSCCLSGSVSIRASKYSRWDWGREFSGGPQHTQNRCGAAKVVKSAVVGGDVLIGSRARTEKVTQFVVGATESISRSWALEPAHRTVAALHPAMILLQPVIQILAIAMPHTGAQHRAYRPRITVVPICRHPVRRDTGDESSPIGKTPSPRPCHGVR
jgi:hypothetical protein